MFFAVTHGDRTQKRTQLVLDCGSELLGEKEEEEREEGSIVCGNREEVAPQ